MIFTKIRKRLGSLVSFLFVIAIRFRNHLKSNKIWCNFFLSLSTYYSLHWYRK